MENKQAKKLEHYDVIIECVIPAKVKWRVLAESPEAAIDSCHKFSPIGVQYSFNQRIEHKATVYKAAQSIIVYVLNLFGKRR